LTRLSVPNHDFVASVAEPGAVVVNGQLQLYFVVTAARLTPTGALATPQAKLSIWRATARDASGSTFGVPIPVLEQTARYPASAGYEGYSTPAALVFGGQVHLFYDVVRYAPGDPVRPQRQVAIVHASSPNGVTAWREDVRPLVQAGDVAWASQEVFAPAPLVDGNQIDVWFTGDSIDGRTRDFSTFTVWIGLLRAVAAPG
jgi:hypothetical protein